MADWVSQRATTAVQTRWQNRRLTMTAESHGEKGARETVQNSDTGDRSPFNLRWLAFIAAASLVINLVLMRKMVLSIYQNFEIQLPQVTSLVLSPYLICCLALVPIAVLAKELAPLPSSKKQDIDSAIICFSLLLGVAATWAIFDSLKILIH